MIPENLKYSKTHQWVSVDGKKAKIGITEYAAKELGDIVYVDLPEVGKELSAGKEFMAIESTKALSEIFTPVSGKITAVNEKLSEEPEIINKEPYGEGWLVEVEIEKEPEDLLDSKAYEELIQDSDKAE
jgi:glycine cleavage system H protein